MKIKLIPMLAGVIALGVMTTPLIAKAQSDFSDPLSPAQLNRQSEWDQLGLSKQQKAEIRRIHQETRTKMQSILTRNQQDQLQAAMQDGQGNNQQAWRQVMASLSSDQRNQIRDLIQQEQSRIQGLLNSDQQQQWQQIQQQMRQQRQQNNQ